MSENPGSSGVSRRSVLRSLAFAGGACSLPVFASSNAQAVNADRIPVYRTTQLENNWDPENNDLVDRLENRDKIEPNYLTTVIAEGVKQIWADEIEDGNEYSREIQGAPLSQPIRESATNSTGLQERAMDIDSHMKEDSDWVKYDGRDAFLILDYNDRNDMVRGDGSAVWGTAGGSSGKVAIVDMAFFEDAPKAYDTGGFYEETFAVGSAFRALATLHNATYHDATTRENGGTHKYSLLARNSYEWYADCGAVSDSADKQAEFVSDCTRSDIRTYIDNNL